MNPAFVRGVPLAVCVLLCSCDARIEGTDRGDCDDAADNDADGLFDCDDDGCSGSPVCDEADTDTDADSDSDTDTDSDADTDTDSDVDTDTDPPSDYTVCGDGTAPFTEIQDAVDDASDGDVIVVCAGTYAAVTIDGTDVSLVGADGADVTRIDGGFGTGLTVDSATVAVTGFTLTGNAPEWHGAAIEAIDADLGVADAIVTDCTSAGMGYCVYQDRGSSTWSDVVFETNSPGFTMFEATDSSGSSSPTGEVDMDHVIFRYNGGMSIMRIRNVDITLTNSLLHDNIVSDGASDPMFMFSPGATRRQTVWNNTFYANQGSPQIVGASQNVDFQNNIISGDSRGGLAYFGDWSTTSYNDLDITLSNAMSGTGNISNDPWFTAPEAGDFSLDSGFSPCVDAGNPLTGYNDVDGSRNDMGAYGGPGGVW